MPHPFPGRSGPHVRAAVDHGQPAAGEEGPAGPQHVGNDSTNSTQLCVAMSIRCSRSPSIASARTTSVSGKVHQKRREKSRNSGLSSSRSGSRGSSVIPHLGRFPDDPGGSPGASGRCRWFRARLAMPPGPVKLRCWHGDAVHGCCLCLCPRHRWHIAPDRRRIWPCIRCCKTSTCSPSAWSGAPTPP